MTALPSGGRDGLRTVRCTATTRLPPIDFLGPNARALAPSLEEPVTDEFSERLRIEPWADPVIDERGYDPRSEYAEWFWLAVVGPSSIWLLRRIAATFDHRPDGFDLEVAECAAALGLTGGAGQHATFLRTVRRMCQFHLARRIDRDTVQVRRRLPPLTRSQVLRLPSSLRVAHEDWMRRELDAHRAARIARAAQAGRAVAAGSGSLPHPPAA